MKEKIILDVDPGHDDTIAIVLAGKNPKIDLQAITVVAGNQTLDKVVKNTLNICSHLDMDLPVAAGMTGPIVRDQITAGEIHGKSGLDGPEFDQVTKKLDDRHAVQLIIDKLMESDEKINLLPVGPMSNIAMALRLEPRIKDKIKQIVFMGGSYTLGNTTPSAEFNIFADPEAAHIVINSGLPITMMGLDLTRKVLATKDIVDKIKSLDNKASDMIGMMMDFYLDNQMKNFGVEAPPIHDPTTVAYLIEPEIFKTRKMNVEVDLLKGSSYGRTICDYYGNTGKEPNVNVAVDIDVDRFWQIVMETLELYR